MSHFYDSSKWLSKLSYLDETAVTRAAPLPDPSCDNRKLTLIPGPTSSLVFTWSNFAKDGCFL